jgi:hypothetical protein
MVKCKNLDHVSCQAAVNSGKNATSHEYDVKGMEDKIRIAKLQLARALEAQQDREDLPGENE